jgi:protein SCO1
MTWKQRLILIGIVAAIAIPFLHGKLQPPQGAAALEPVTQEAFGGPLTSLTAHTGAAFDESAIAGKYRLIYFGFTFCPAICPTELSKMTEALKTIGEKAGEVQPLFITVDPERDTAEALKNYVTLFHPSLIGLTGTTEAIKNVTKAYKIYAAKVDDPQMSEYTMDHSSFIYFIAPDGRLLHIFKMQDKASFMADVMSQWMDSANSNQ